MKRYSIGISMPQELIDDLKRPPRSEPLPYKPDPIETLVEAARKIPELVEFADEAMKYWESWNE